MKTKITLILTAIWAVLVALNESDILDLIPDGNNWVKFIIAFGVVLGNTFLADPKEAIKSIGGGGIKPPRPDKSIGGGGIKPPRPIK